MPESDPFSYLDAVIDVIDRGTRAVLFPPGFGAFVSTSLTFIIGGDHTMHAKRRTLDIGNR
jgi:hypothetical protein